MSKRKLNDKQRARVNTIQLQYHTDDNAIGLVLCSFGKKAEVETNDGTIITCFIRPNLPTLVAGDNVVWQKLPAENSGIIERLLPRKTVLMRHLKKSGLNQPLAANLTQMIIVIAKEPEVDWCLLDTYLVTAETLNLNAVIVLNKMDLASNEIKLCLENNYKQLGYSLVYTTTKNIHLSKLAEENESGFNLPHLTNQISIMVGQSGVGKSSLIKKIIPTFQEINSINQDAKAENTHAASITTLPLTKKSFGQHTTTTARFYRLDKNTGIIDSPGVRAFNPIDLTPELVLKGFRELHPFIGKCKFRNCNHLNSQQNEDASEAGNKAENSSAKNIYSQQLDFQRGANRTSTGVYIGVNEDASEACNKAENSSAKSIKDSGCAIAYAAAQGSISKFRYKNLIKLLTQLTL